MKGQTLIAERSACLAALLVLTPLLLGATAYRSNETQLAFLSNSEKDQPPVADVPTFPPPTDANAFDGRWRFTGCRMPRGWFGFGGHQGRQSDRPRRWRKRHPRRDHPYGRRWQPTNAHRRGAIVWRFRLWDIRSVRRLLRHLDRDQAAPLAARPDADQVTRCYCRKRGSAAAGRP